MVVITVLLSRLRWAGVVNRGACRVLIDTWPFSPLWARSLSALILETQFPDLIVILVLRSYNPRLVSRSRFIIQSPR